MAAFGLSSFVYSINFQRRQISAGNQYSSWEKNPFSSKPTVVQFKNYERKTLIFPDFNLLTTDYQLEKELFCH